MKASAPSISPEQSDTKVALGPGLFLELAKARLTALVLFTTLVGFYMGTEGPPDLVLMLNALIGTGLLASGAAALNQLIERNHDSRMVRTESRPLPSGRIRPEAVLAFGGMCSGGGLAYLAVAVNGLTCVLGGVTLVTYLLVYTPLKRKTPWNTNVGAVAGALPPLMGWAAVRGELTGGGWTLFAILFLWQLPHFLSIAWMYKDDYARAGFVMLPMTDSTGGRTGRHALGNCVALLAASVLPFFIGLSGFMYLAGALVLGVAFIVFTARFYIELNCGRARQLFFMSIVYLPLVLTIMVLDKTG